MTILLPTLAVASAALCVWLTVRIVNRRERWAKWTLAAIVGLPAVYVASIGPACWIASHSGSRATWTSHVYAPITKHLSSYRQSPFSSFVNWYSELLAADDWRWSHVWDYSPRPPHWEFLSFKFINGHN